MQITFFPPSFAQYHVPVLHGYRGRLRLPVAAPPQQARVNHRRTQSSRNRVNPSLSITAVYLGRDLVLEHNMIKSTYSMEWKARLLGQKQVWLSKPLIISVNEAENRNLSGWSFKHRQQHRLPLRFRYLSMLQPTANHSNTDNHSNTVIFTGSEIQRYESKWKMWGSYYYLAITPAKIRP